MAGHSRPRADASDYICTQCVLSLEHPQLVLGGREGPQTDWARQAFAEAVRPLARRVRRDRRLMTEDEWALVGRYAEVVAARATRAGGPQSSAASQRG